MKKILVLMLMLLGCHLPPNEGIEKQPIVTVSVMNNSFYDVVVYVDGKRNLTVNSNEIRCLKLWYNPYLAEISFSPIGSSAMYVVPNMNFASQKNWKWDIGNNYNLSANIGVSPSDKRCGK